MGGWGRLISLFENCCTRMEAEIRLSHFGLEVNQRNIYGWGKEFLWKIVLDFF